MTVEAGPNIVSSSMALSLDPSNSKSYNSSENLYTYSEDFSQAVWLKGASVTVTPNSAIAPDNTNTANKIVLGVGWAGQIPVYRSANTSALYTYTESFYVKEAGWNYAYLWFDNGSGFGCTLEINLSTGATRNTRIGDNTYYTGFSTSVMSVGNGWYRISITATMTASGTGVQFRIYPSNVAWVSGNFGTPSSIVGDGINGIYIWGGQFEKSNAMSKYTKTTTTAITRSTVMYDMNNNGINSTVVDPIFSPLNSGHLAMNGSTTYIDTGYKFLRNYNNGTISVWAKATDTAVVGHFYYEGSGGDGFGVEVEANMTSGSPANSISIYFPITVGGHWVSSISMPSNTWFNAVLTYSYAADNSSATVSAYFNGILNSTSVVTPNRSFTGGNSLLGRPEGYGATPARSFVGSISKFDFYDRVLSAVEVSQNFNALRGRYGI